MPKASPVEAKMGINAAPIPVEARPMEVAPRVVIAVITEVSLKVAVVARRLNRFASLSRDSISFLRNYFKLVDLS